MIEKSLILPCTQERAFELFTARIDDWWPADRRHVAEAGSVIALSAVRFWERARGGDAVELGRVRLWEPPARIVLDWFPGTDAEHPTEVDVRFLPEDAGTRIHITHRAGAASVDLFPLRAPRYDASWELVLASLEAHWRGSARV